MLIAMRRSVIPCAVLVALISVPPCFADDGNQSAMTSGAIVNTSICELVADPQRFSGKIVEVQAQYESDGIHSRVLVDPKCPGGILPSGQAHDPLVGSSLLEALQHGCPGTRDKQIVATWIGEYHWEPENKPGSGKAPRWLDVQKIENLEVKPRLGGPPCPRR
jgi:hypothetical protein